MLKNNRRCSSFACIYLTRDSFCVLHNGSHKNSKNEWSHWNTNSLIILCHLSPELSFPLLGSAWELPFIASRRSCAVTCHTSEESPTGLKLGGCLKMGFWTKFASGFWVSRWEGWFQQRGRDHIANETTLGMHRECLHDQNNLTLFKGGKKDFIIDHCLGK